MLKNAYFFKLLKVAYSFSTDTHYFLKSFEKMNTLLLAIFKFCTTKNLCIFFGKRCKKSPQRRGLRPQTPVLLLPPIITILLKFISSTKCGLLPSKKNKFCIF